MATKTNGRAPIEQIGRQALSIVLSFLSENEGCSLLITRRTWARQMLPIFRLPPAKSSLAVVNGEGQPRRRPLNRHRFQVIVVPDPIIRLFRLNTRRLFRREQYASRLAEASLDSDAHEKLGETAFPLAQHDWDCLEKRKFRYPNGSSSSSVSFPPLLRFLSKDADPFLPGTTVLASYPRSGNTLLRTYLEHCIGVVTGSDTRPDRTLSLALAAHHELVGEGVCSRSQVGICKTHWPERVGFCPYRARRAVVLVRNPYDAIDSYWHLAATNTHTEKVTNAVYEEHAEFYEALVRNEMDVWCRFHNFWMSLSEEIPIVWVRYEDLVRDPKGELRRILSFATSRNHSNEVDWETHINDSVDIVRNKQIHQKTGYLKSGGKGVPAKQRVSFGRSLRRFPRGIVDDWHDRSVAIESADSLDTPSMLSRFGYNVKEQMFPQNITTFDPPRILERVSTPSPSVTINERGLDLRPRDCPFGRNTRNWRRSHTADDTVPFPVMSKRS